MPCQYRVISQQEACGRRFDNQPPCISPPPPRILECTYPTGTLCSTWTYWSVFLFASKAVKVCKVWCRVGCNTFQEENEMNPQRKMKFCLRCFFVCSWYAEDMFVSFSSFLIQSPYCYFWNYVMFGLRLDFLGNQVAPAFMEWLARIGSSFFLFSTFPFAVGLLMTPLLSSFVMDLEWSGIGRRVVAASYRNGSWPGEKSIFTNS